MAPSQARPHFSTPQEANTRRTADLLDSLDSHQQILLLIILANPLAVEHLRAALGLPRTPQTHSEYRVALGRAGRTAELFS